MMMMNQFPLVSLFSMAIQKVYCIPGILHFQTYPCCFTLAPTPRAPPRHQARSPRHSSGIFQPRLMTPPWVFEEILPVGAEFYVYD
jgi:hypothetical protein